MDSERAWDIAVVGGANTDFLVRGERLPTPGETVQGSEFQTAPGGKGANQAVGAARLGARVAFISRIGRDARGDEMIARLNAEGVDTFYVTRDESTYTGVALVMVDQRGEKQILAAPGANQTASNCDVIAARDAITGARILLTQLELPLEPITTAIQLAHASGVRVILDPAPPVPLPDDLLRQVDVIKPDRDEAHALTGIEVTNRASARAAAHQLLERGVRAVAAQAGEEGDLIVTRDQEIFLPRLSVHSIDATGAGDAFAAALAVALSEGWDWEQAGHFANAAAALKTTKLGAQAGLPRREDVMAMLEHV